jgi:DNA-binding response OmpR family regulator
MTNHEHSTKPEHPACVVVADDNDDLRRVLAMALDTAGFEVLQARTQLELQRVLTDVRPDALVLDLQRSEADGLPLLTRLRARQSLRDVPIVFLAGSADDSLRQQALTIGADWFGLRPLGMAELQSRVAELLRAGRAAGRGVHEVARTTGAVALKPTG